VIKSTRIHEFSARFWKIVNQISEKSGKIEFDHFLLAGKNKLCEQTEKNFCACVWKTKWSLNNLGRLKNQKFITRRENFLNIFFEAAITEKKELRQTPRINSIEIIYKYLLPPTEKMVIYTMKMYNIKDIWIISTKYTE
jgi:hypothetical protein